MHETSDETYIVVVLCNEFYTLKKRFPHKMLQEQKNFLTGSAIIESCSLLDFVKYIHYNYVLYYTIPLYTINMNCKQPCTQRPYTTLLNDMDFGFIHFIAKPTILVWFSSTGWC